MRLVYGAAIALVALPAVGAVVPDEQVVIQPTARFTLGQIQARVAEMIQLPVQEAVKPPKTRRGIAEIGPPKRGIGDAPAIEPGAGAGAAAALAPTTIASCPPSTNFQVRDDFLAAADNNTSIPPDTTGAVGPNHLVATLNTDIVIRLRDGSPAGSISLDNFFGIPLGGNPFDPRVTFDEHMGRWIIVADANGGSPNSAVYIAVSQTDDPTGTWNFFAIDADAANTTWADYPGLGYNEKWLTVTNNMFTNAGSFAGVKMWVIEKTPLAGGTLVVHAFNPGFDLGPFGFQTFCMKPVRSRDTGADLYCVSNPGLSSSGTPVLRLSAVSGPENAPVWSQVPGSVFENPGDPPSGYFIVDNSFDYGFPAQRQLGTTLTVDGGDYRVSGDPKLFNGSVYLAHSGGLPVGAPDRAAAFWYELDPAAMIATGDPIVQSGFVEDGAGSSASYPSIASNCAGDVVVGFSHAKPSQYIAAALAYRQSTDAPGSIGPITTIKPGEDTYLKDFGSGRRRWGDYSETLTDPADDGAIWTIQEYAETDVGPSTSSDRWGVWWAKLAGDAPVSCVADVTTTNTNPGDPGYGAPDGFVDGADLSYYVEQWVNGCP